MTSCQIFTFWKDIEQVQLFMIDLATHDKVVDSRMITKRTQ
jgi:hypothetical protein